MCQEKPVLSEPFPDLEARVRDVRALSDGSIAVMMKPAERSFESAKAQTKTHSWGAS